MTLTMKRATTFLSAAIASLLLGAFAVYVLYNFKTGLGLVIASLAFAIGLGIAFKTDLHNGVAAVRENAATLAPIIVDAIRGTKKADEPPSGGDGT